MRHRWYVLAIVVLAACGGDDDPPAADAATATIDAAPACMTVTGSIPADGAMDVDADTLAGGARVQLSHTVDNGSADAIRVEANAQDQANVSAFPGANDPSIVLVELGDSFLVRQAKPREGGSPM